MVTAKVEPKDRVAMALGLTGLGMGTAALVAALTREVKAEELLPGEVTVDGAVREALAALIVGQENIKGALQGISTTLDNIRQGQGEVNTTLVGIRDALTALGAEPPGEQILEPFKKENATLQSKSAFPIDVVERGVGSLVWAVIDVSDPDTTIGFRFDNLVWEFNYNDLLTQGIQQPLFPGAWLSKADAIASHYCMVFSAGDIKGFGHKSRFQVVATFHGTGTATLHQGSGVRWVQI